METLYINIIFKRVYVWWRICHCYIDEKNLWMRIQGQVVAARGWLSIAEFTDLITISQMTPGPIAVNSATFVGLKIAGVPGAIVATLGYLW